MLEEATSRKCEFGRVPSTLACGPFSSAQSLRHDRGGKRSELIDVVDARVNQVLQMSFDGELFAARHDCAVARQDCAAALQSFSVFERELGSVVSAHSNLQAVVEGVSEELANLRVSAAAVKNEVHVIDSKQMGFLSDREENRRAIEQVGSGLNEVKHVRVQGP